MELDDNDLLIDHLQFTQILEFRIDLNSLSTRPRNALKRALLRRSDWQPNSERFEVMKRLSYVKLIDISQLRISDIRDLQHVGESTLVELVQQLQNSLTSNVNEEVYVDNNARIDSLEDLRSRIRDASTLEILIEAMIDYQKAIHELSDKEEKIWRFRLPWITDSPRTLDSIGAEIGLTRERIRQIQSKSKKFAYEVNSPVFVLTEIQNILIGCSNHDEFRSAMIEEELTENQDVTIGRIRYIAVELEQGQVVSEVERAIYAWASQ
jgi:hypothetical protein